MSAATGPATIAEKIYAILQRDDDGNGFIGTAHGLPEVERRFTPVELDLIDWGAVYGLAFGIARSENPWESIEEVAARAYAEAWPLFRDKWVDRPTPFSEEGS